MLELPSGLWSFTEMVIAEIEKLAAKPLKIEVHDPAGDEESDFLWGDLTPHLELSEGEYLKIDQIGDECYSEFGTRGCCGGDPTFGGYSFLQPTKENALLVATEYIEYFTRKD